MHKGGVPEREGVAGGVPELERVAVAVGTGGPGEGVADGEMHDAASAVEPAGHAAGHPHAMGAAAFAGQ